MRLTVNQAIEELKRLAADEMQGDNIAIEERYGTVENSRIAYVKMRDFIVGCGYCSHCYEKQKSIDDLDCCMCNSCYNWEENQYLFGGI